MKTVLSIEHVSLRYPYYLECMLYKVFLCYIYVQLTPYYNVQCGILQELHLVSKHQLEH